MNKFLFAAVAAVLSAAAMPAFAQEGGEAPRVVTRAEIQQMTQARFSEMDANHDGFVTKEELGGGAGGDRAAAMISRLDTDHDGKVSLAELSAIMLARFDATDANHDGTVTPEEREAARAAMRARFQQQDSAKPQGQ